MYVITSKMNEMPFRRCSLANVKNEIKKWREFVSKLILSYSLPMTGVFGQFQFPFYCKALLVTKLVK